MRQFFIPAFTIIFTLFIQSCVERSGKKPNITDSNQGLETQEDIDLSYSALGKIDSALYEQGKELFYGKCAHCHKLDYKKIGPPLRYVTRHHSAEWLTNLLKLTSVANDVMEKDSMNVHSIRHKDTVAISGQRSAGKGQKTTPEERRAIIEFLRKEGKE